jgi:hypothetical protein
MSFLVNPSQSYSPVVNEILAKSSQQGMQNIPFGEYVDKILELANSTFAVMYHKFYKKYWHDGSFFSKMTQNYTTTDWQNAVFETYIPTRDTTHGLSYYRIAIKLVPTTNNEEFHDQAYKLRTPLHMPPGQIDSELIIVISQRINKWGFIRCFNHTPQRTKGYQTNIYITNRREKASKTSMGGQLIVTPPEVLWVKITRAICEFINVRINGLLKAMKLKRWQLDAKDNNSLYYILLNSAVISPFSHSLRTTLLSLSQTLDVLLHKIWEINEDIGAQNLAKRVIQPLKGLSPGKLTNVWSYIREGLEIELNEQKQRLNPQELAIIKAVMRHS